MKRARSRIACALVLALLSVSPPLRAQQRLDVAVEGESVPRVIRLAQAQPLAAAPDVQVRSAGSDEGAGNASRQVSPLGRPEHELSPWSMFMSADILVKAVMISLAFASLVTWTIFLAMTFQLSMARRRLGEALARVAEARTLAEAQVGLGPSRNVLSSLLAAALQEVRLSADSPVEGGIKERVSLRFAEIVRGEAKVPRHGMGILATIGSTAPFVGLFGTVWGIMNSFIGISKSQTTNLAVVAPGIAEALLATAIGLIAAIPAVIIYNHFSRATKGYLDLVRRASGAVARLLSRDIDRTYGRMLSRAAE